MKQLSWWCWWLALAYAILSICSVDGNAQRSSAKSRTLPLKETKDEARRDDVRRKRHLVSYPQDRVIITADQKNGPEVNSSEIQKIAGSNWFNQHGEPKLVFETSHQVAADSPLELKDTAPAVKQQNQRAAQSNEAFNNAFNSPANRVDELFIVPEVTDSSVIQDSAEPNDQIMVPKFSDGSYETYRLVGAPVLDSGTISVVVIFGVLVLIAMVFMFTHHCSCSSTPRHEFSAVSIKYTKRRTASTRHEESTPLGTSQVDCNSLEVLIDEGDGCYATRKRVQNESLNAVNVESQECDAKDLLLPDVGADSQEERASFHASESELGSESEYGKLDDDEVMFNYRTVEDEVDDLENGSQGSAADIEAEAVTEAMQSNIITDWSTDSDSDENAPEGKRKWAFW